MTESVQTDVLHYELIRSRRKTVGLSLDQTGKLTVRAPLSLRREAIDEIVSSHRDWITRHRAAIDALPPPFVLREGASLSILGKPRIVRFRHADAIQLLEDQLILPSGTADADLTAWLRAMALSVVQSRVDVFAAQMGLSPTAVSVTGAQARWGSCSPRNRLSFAWRILFCEPEALDYVVVHELAHIRHKNHGADFHALVRSILPDEAARHAWLRANGHLLRLFS